jgi:lambda family phage portal protein
MFERLREFFRPELLGPPRAPSVPHIQARAAYEAGTAGGRRTIDWRPADVSANVATASAPTIRARCRDAMRNDSWARAIVETLVDDVIGWGVKPMCRATSESFRQAVQQRWDDWTAVADADGLLDFNGLQALAVRNLIVDGECFIRLRRRLPDDGLPVPLQIQILPSEICPIDTSTARPMEGGVIRDGIEFDRIGRRTAYWLLDTPPGEDATFDAMTAHRVPASQVLHLFEPLRPGQRRGVSMLAPALVRLRELDKYADATLLRLQISTMLVGTIKPNPTPIDASYDPLTGEEIREREDGRPVVRMEPGVMQELGPGEELTFNDPPVPPAGFEAFVRHELRAAGAAVGVPLECFTHDWGATNDRLARVVLNQYRRRVHRLLWSIVVPQFLRKVWDAWFQLAVLSMPHTPDEADRLGRVTFAPHAHAYVHPVQDVESYSRAIRAGLTSRQAAVAETGEDVEIIDAQIAADNARADKLGIVLTTDPRKGGDR